MKRDNFLWRALLIFAVALIGYAVIFKWIGHRRVVKGPWAVTFATESDVPILIVNQPKLGIRDVRIVFAGERVTTNPAQTLDFAQPRPVPFEVPFGKCVFLDPLFLPGTVALELFGHEIQLLPRVLTIDKVERPWRNGETVELQNVSTPR
jgi:hypothetical protein